MRLRADAMKIIQNAASRQNYYVLNKITIYVVFTEISLMLQLASEQV